MSTETDDREHLARALEREAALLRRPDFEVARAHVEVVDEPNSFHRVVNIRLAWDTKTVSIGPATWEDYHGWETDRSYDSIHVAGRYAHAYESAHYPEGDTWYLRVHQRDSSHLGERWFGGRVLADAANRGFLKMTRDEAIAAADMWAHHAELPASATT